jgi:hypothetical protein
MLPRSRFRDLALRKLTFRQRFRKYVLCRKSVIPSEREVDRFGKTLAQRGFPDVEDAKIIREMIWHEDLVLNSRLTWCGAIESLLMACLALSWKETALVVIISFVGIVVGVSTLYATWTAVDTMRELTEWWSDRTFPSYNGPDVIGHRAHRWRWTILRPSLALPSTFVLLWLAVAIVRIGHLGGTGRGIGEGNHAGDGTSISRHPSPLYSGREPVP